MEPQADVPTVSSEDPNRRVVSPEEDLGRRALERATAIAQLRESQVELNLAVASVAASVESVSALVGTLATAMQTKASKRETRNWFRVGLVIFAVAFGFIFWRSSENHSVLTKFAECTTPGNNPPPHTGHDCYDASVARTATVQLAIDCDNEALLRYYLRVIPSVALPSIRSQCQVALVPATGTTSTTTGP